MLLEVPAGTREPNEPPERTAARELTEETGYTADRIIPLGAFFTKPGFCTEEIHAYLAVGLPAAAVIGVRDEEGEEVPKAFVVLKEPMSAEEIMEFVASQVAPHKKVRRVEVVDQIPKSPTGKILRRVLRDREKAVAH